MVALLSGDPEEVSFGRMETVVEHQEQLTLARDFEKWILAIVSHDIRNPLGTILFAARRLQDIAAPASAEKKHAAMVERGLHRISTESLSICVRCAGRSLTSWNESRMSGKSRSIAMSMVPARG